MSTNKSHNIAPKTRVLLVNTGSPKKRFILKRLKQLDCEVVCLNAEKNWAAPYVSDWILADTNNHTQALDAVSSYLRKNNVEGVVTFWEDDVLLTSKIIDQFGFTGISHQVAQQARNKYLFREFCRKNNLPTPQHRLVKNINQTEKIAGELSFPVVVKPAFGSSSAYVIKAKNSEELQQTAQYIWNNLDESVESALHEGKNIIVEEYIDGEEVDIDILVQNGKIKFWSITDNFQTHEPFFVETGEAIPSSLPQVSQQALVNMAEEVLEKLTITNGCIHFEAKMTSSGPVPIEVNLRMGGDDVHSFVEGAWHVDLIERAVMIATDQYFPRIEKPTEPYAFLAGEYFLPSKAGVISSTELPDTFPKELRVQEFHFDPDVGDTVLTPPAAYDYLGWITVKGDNPEDARGNLSSAVKLVNYEIVPFSGLSAVGKTERRSALSSAFLQSSAAMSKEKIERIRHIDRANLKKLRIGVACNTYDTKPGSVEAELTSVGKNIQAALETKGYHVTFIDFNNLSKAIEILQSNTIDFVFNVGERLNDSSLLEPHIASLLDIFQIPYTGSNPFTLGLCIDKIRVKKLLDFHSIPTAKWDYLYSQDDQLRDDLTFPLIVKPANTDNSIGITQDSVVTNEKELKKQIQYVMQELKRPALIEEYLSGDEYDVSILGSELDDLRVLPLSRSIFPDDQGKWNIYTFDSKFSATHKGKGGVVVERPPKNVSKKLLSLISEIALDTYQILDCHDYGRVEIKLDKDNNPHILELNPNPSINITDCLPSVGKIDGMEYGEFLEEIIFLAVKRYKDKPPYYHLQPTLR